MKKDKRSFQEVQLLLKLMYQAPVTAGYDQSLWSRIGKDGESDDPTLRSLLEYSGDCRSEMVVQVKNKQNAEVTFLAFDSHVNVSAVSAKYNLLLFVRLLVMKYYCSY
ncbi:hypothetical protein Bca52824_031203 [Brassica carinata]|uniref:Uncharacterized protein n=1 Tax=Brassica carinata TaxID=52824 RepID=A0A8X7V552_BRACI|nr:hypothetical protein Bca52824_031203 [Brassica carinata]